MLSACAPPAGSIAPQAVRDTVSKDRAQVYQHAAITEALTLEDVLARALRYNLDTRVAELDELIAADDVTLEMLRALPSVNAKIQRVGRNNPGGSSSFSLLTGTQSLQPSISSEQYRTTQQLGLEWNLLDAGINIGRAKSASDRVLIAQERRRKVYHGIVQDTYAAYWRVAAAQMTLPVIADLLARSQEQIGIIEQQMKEGLVPLGDARAAKTQLLDSRKELINLQQALMLAEVELKTLIDYPIDQPITLDLGGKDWLQTRPLPSIKGDIAAFEETAFMNRPEIREEILNKRISTRDIKLTILETFPGLDLIFSYNRDNNKFLSYNSWVDGIIGISQSINRIITAPARYDRAKKVDQLADKRRQALIAAIITQVNIAVARYDFLSNTYEENVAADENTRDILKSAMNFKDAGIMSKPQLLNAEIEAGIATVNRAFAYVDVQDSYARFITTLGVDLWDADNAGLSVPDFARQIKNNLADENLFLSMNAEGGATP